MSYYKKIDGLRSVAIIMVLVEHFAHYVSKGLSIGYFGVDLFFVISGFLITKILIKPNEAPFTKNYFNFLGRRTIRIFPIYYGTLIILWLLGLKEVRENIFNLATYTYNYSSVIKGLSANPISHFWSLCVEEQFYLFWPIIVLLCKSKPKLLLGIIISMITFGYSQMVFNIFPNISAFNFVGLQTRMASLAMGALGAVLIQDFYIPKRIITSKYLEYFMLFSLLILLSIETPFKYISLGFCSLYIVLKSALSNFSIKGINKILENDFMVNIGMVSYGIYIFHKPVAHYFAFYIFDPIWNNINFESLGVLSIIRWHSWIIKLPLYAFITYFIAKNSFEYIEKPLLGLKDKFFKY